MTAHQLDIFGKQQPVMSRTFAMPSADTFSLRPIAEFIERNANRRGLVVDPFARNSRLADIRNDLNPNTAAENHMDAVEFLRSLAGRDDITTVLFDPPYSPRQITECYSAAGLTATMKDTQSGRFYRECRNAISAFIRPGGVVLWFGWNSIGMGRKWQRVETLLVYHGGAHNDTICSADRFQGESDDGSRIHSHVGAGSSGCGMLDGRSEGGCPERLLVKDCLCGSGRCAKAAERDATLCLKGDCCASCREAA